MKALTKPLFILFLSAIPLSLAFAEMVAAKRAVADIAIAAPVNASQKNCEMKKTTSVNMSFNLQNQPELLNAETFMDDKMQEIKDIAAELGITEINIQSYNVNMSVNNYGGCGANGSQKMYQINGNVNTQITPAEKGPELLKAMVEKGYTGNLYLNANRQCY